MEGAGVQGSVEVEDGIVESLRNRQRSQNQVHWAGRDVRGGDQQQRPQGTGWVPLEGDKAEFDYP